MAVHQTGINVSLKGKNVPNILMVQEKYTMRENIQRECFSIMYLADQKY